MKCRDPYPSIEYSSPKFERWRSEFFEEVLNKHAIMLDCHQGPQKGWHGGYYHSKRLTSTRNPFLVQQQAGRPVGSYVVLVQESCHRNWYPDTMFWHSKGWLDMSISGDCWLVASWCTFEVGFVLGVGYLLHVAEYPIQVQVPICTSKSYLDLVLRYSGDAYMHLTEISGKLLLV